LPDLGRWTEKLDLTDAEQGDLFMERTRVALRSRDAELAVLTASLTTTLAGAGDRRGRDVKQ